MYLLGAHSGSSGTSLRYLTRVALRYLHSRAFGGFFEPDAGWRPLNVSGHLVDLHTFCGPHTMWTGNLPHSGINLGKFVCRSIGVFKKVFKLEDDFCANSAGLKFLAAILTLN